MAKISTEGWPVQVLPFKSSAKFPISLSGHMVLVFKDDNGKEFQINAGPGNESYPYGQLILRDIGSPLKNRFNVEDGSKVNAAWRGSTKVDFGKRDAEDVWDILLQHAQNIDNAEFDYKAFTKNSNSVIGTLLDVVGIDIKHFLPDPRGIMLGGFVGKNAQLNFDFSLTGTEADDFLRGRKGQQTFTGRDGDDHLVGGYGQDRLYGNADRDLLIGGRGKDLLFGGTGRDKLFGGGENDILKGGQGNDLLVGGMGGDRLFGKDGADVLKGQNGHDIIEGGSGADLLVGGIGNDKLRGEDGDDTLKGGGGDDLLRGGAGADRLRGDAGDDTFVFKRPEDSGFGADADKVLDFESGEDVIDIAGLADGFVFVEDGLTGTGPSFTLEETKGDTSVQVDVDGDGAADMEIILKDVIGLGEDDFIF